MFDLYECKRYNHSGCLIMFEGNTQVIGFLPQKMLNLLNSL